MQHCLVKHNAHLHMGKRRSYASRVWHNVDCPGTPGESSYGSIITEERSMQLQGWEEILKQGICIHHVSVKIPEI